MVRVPVPSVPSKLVEVTVAASVRRGVPNALLVAPGGEGESGAEVCESAPQGDHEGLPPVPVCLRGGAPLPRDWTPVARVSGKAGDVHQLRGERDSPRWLLGVGEREPKNWRTAGAALIRAVNAEVAAAEEAGERAAKSVLVELSDEIDVDAVVAFVLGLRLGGYRFTVTEEKPSPRARSVILVTSDEREDAVRAAVAEAVELSAATALARDLANSPSNVKDPDWLARTAERIAADVNGLKAEVRDEHWLAERGFGGMLAVGGGSARPPRLIELSYRPRGAGTHLLLVGKGITFDTGGFSLKPADGMHLMRTDMAGGAAVIGAMRAIATLGLGVRVSALVPVAENLVSGSAYRPGDVVRHYGGRTSEIANTDAEGRIVLADALAYGIERFAPDVVVDVATLTGAMKVALGLRTGGVFATDDELVKRVAEAGAGAGEAWWPMPLLEDHADAVLSEIADVKQAPSGPGGITAALFLREFTDGVPWAHLDIAGPARADKVYDEVSPGGTGFGARTLVRLAASYT